MRISYQDEEDFSGQFDLWQGNCQRSINGRLGQAELRELRTALLNLPEKRLIHGSLTNADGEVCAIGAYAKHKGLDLGKFDPEEETDEVGISAGMQKLIAWKVVEMNDFELEQVAPEKRYELMLAWIEENLKEKPE